MSGRHDVGELFTDGRASGELARRIRPGVGARLDRPLEAQGVQPRIAFGLSAFGLELHYPSAVLATSVTIAGRRGA